VNADLVERNETLELQLRAMRKAFAPRLLFPMEWRLTPTEAVVLECLYKSPDGFRSNDQLAACSYSYVKKGERLPEGGAGMAAHVCKLRRKLRPYRICILTVHWEGYRLPPDSRKIISAYLRQEESISHFESELVERPAAADKDRRWCGGPSPPNEHDEAVERAAARQARRISSAE
jgi:DNA-binding winged helix-turn-helix (wHTH) protein